MLHASKWRPRKRIAINIHARRRFVHLVCPIADLNGRLAQSIRKHARYRRSMRQQMRQKRMLLQQSLAVADRSMMTLDEHLPTARAHHAGRGKRPRAHRLNLNRLAASRELPQQRTHLVQRQRCPVGFHQLAIESVRFCRCAHCKLSLLAGFSNLKKCNAPRAAPSLARRARQTCRRNSRRCRSSSACRQCYWRRSGRSRGPLRRRVCNARPC
jgi:hypothetical protein